MKNLFITALAGLLVACGQNSAQISHIEPDQSQSVKLQNISAKTIISIKRSGNPNGRTVVLIAGLASSPEVWASTITKLQDVDLRLVNVAGFAGEPRYETENNYTDEIASALNDHLALIPGNDTAIIGHSMGGFVALKAALRDRTAIKTLIIVDSLPFLAGMLMPGTTPEQASITATAMAKQMASMPRKAFDRQQAMGLSRLVKTKTYRANIKEWGLMSDQAIVAQPMGELLSSDLRKELTAIQANIKVIAAHDKAMGMDAEQIKRIYEAQYANAPLHDITVISDSFHFIMIDQEEAFIDAVTIALK